MNVYFKKVAPKPDTRPKTAREAVTRYGDDWRLFMDVRKGYGAEIGDKEGPGWRGAATMRMLERGELPRVSLSDVVAGTGMVSIKGTTTP